MTHSNICNTSYGKKKGRESKCWESTRFSCVQVVCNTPLKSSRRELQLCFKPCPNRRFDHEVIAPQSCRNSNHGSFGTLFESPGTKNHLDVALMERCRVYYMKKCGGFPRVRAVDSLVSPKSCVACPSTKGANIVLTNMLVGLMQIRVNN
jgi:hypothetical protein